MNLSQSVAAYIKMLQAYHGLDEEEVSKLIGVSRSTVSNLLQDKGNLRLKTVETVAANLGMNPVALLGYPSVEKTWKLLLELPEVLAALLAMPVDKRVRFMELLNELVQLWNERMP